MLENWSTIQKLIWLYMIGVGVDGTPETKNGVSPLSLTNALAKAITSLTRYGKCEQDDTPAPSAPVDIVCNNGALKWDSVNHRVYTTGTPEVVTVSASGASDQTATVQNLLACGTYEDTQDIISGAVTRKCKVLVLDGTEGWTLNSNYGYFWLNYCDWPITRSIQPYCTHFVGTVLSGSSMPNNTITCRADNMMELDIKSDQFADAAALQSFLAGQYSAGTPVMLVYPMNTEVQESVTPQPLHTKSGTNTVTATANVSDPKMEVVYTKKS